MSVGSAAMNSGDEATRVCPFDSKKVKNFSRITESFMCFFLAVNEIGCGGCNGVGGDPGARPYQAKLLILRGDVRVRC